MDKIIAVASGKGGVGKSTVATNLAVALAGRNDPASGRPLKVALVDVDFYGPSIPTLMGGGEIKVGPDNRFIPAEKWGVSYISIAFFLRNDDDPVVWRGPMFGKAITQLFQDVEWGDIDVCIVDLPPGTGDAQLSLSQLVKLDGVLMVTTPQEVAMADVRRAINMFGKVNVPVLGLVENMAGFVTPTGEKFDIFGVGGGVSLSERYGIPLMGSLPIDLKVRVGGDQGCPVAVDTGSELAEKFYAIGEQLLEKIAVLRAGRGSEPELKIVN